VSHDLKQPISAVSLYSGFLRHRAAKQQTPPQLVADTAAKIEEAVGNLHAQIDRLLELSRLESGAMPMRPERLDLDDAIRATLAVLAPQAQARGVQLRWALGRQREVWADPRMLDSILSNLLSNAIKHAEGGRVYVGTRWRHTGGADVLPRFCIEVRDSGTGIAPEQLPLLFDAYRSFDDRRASASHGLGLAIAKAQASYLGCDIHVRSQPGCGSTFTLCGLNWRRPEEATERPQHSA
jgi:signal transduction histidine kinase